VVYDIFSDPFIFFTVKNIKIERSLLETEVVWSLIVQDINGDGVKDIFPSGHDKKEEIYYGGDLSSPHGFRSEIFAYGADRHSCTADDFDLNGLADIYCSRGAQQGKEKNK
jgi:hypothetical protein